MSKLVSKHRSFILSAVKAGTARTSSTIDRRVIESWTRCVNEYGLDPALRPEPMVQSREDLRERQERFSVLLSFARGEMANLHQQLAGSGFAVLLTDPEGVVLDHVSDPEFADGAAGAGMMPGAVWSERHQGTNGIGTCLTIKQPIVIHHAQHFLATNTGLTCSAAPICDDQGNVLAILDASSYSHRAQQHTLALVNMSAQALGNRLFLWQFRNELVLRFHSRPEFVGTLGEGEIALSNNGTVLAANTSALFQLGYRSRLEIVGKSIGEVFDLSMDSLLESGARSWVLPIPVHETRHGNRFFVITQPPESLVLSRGVGFGGGATLGSATSSRNRHTAGPLDSLQLGDPRMARNVRCAKRVLNSGIPVLLSGETGTGKEIFARAIHNAEGGDDRPFVAVNCASIPASLIESELFGYKPGAFTGASREGYRGKILQANGGTLFLDEIGDMPLALQARLLRVLDACEVLPLGGETPIKVEFKVISATHRSLPDLVAKSEFREDLYYRLQGLTLSLPPLRERQDKREIIKHVLALEANDAEAVEIEEDALELLEGYRWPGNIRQLRNVLRLVLALKKGPTIRVRDLLAEIAGSAIFANVSTQADASCGAAPCLNALDSAERGALIKELEAHHWRVTNVAKRLGLSRNTLYRKMRRLNIATGKAMPRREAG